MRQAEDIERGGEGSKRIQSDRNLLIEPASLPLKRAGKLQESSKGLGSSAGTKARGIIQEHAAPGEYRNLAEVRGVVYLSIFRVTILSQEQRAHLKDKSLDPTIQHLKKGL